MNHQPAVYADIILPLAVPQNYTYRIPDELSASVRVGCRVSIALGKRKLYTGIVRNIHQSPPEGVTIQPLLALIEPDPLVNEIQIQFWEWLASYYMCTVGEVYRAAVPSGLKLESETRVFRDEPDKPVELSETELNLLSVLDHSPGVTVEKLSASVDRKNIMPQLKSLMEKGYIIIEENLKESYRDRTVDYVYLHEVYIENTLLQSTLDELEKRAPKQARLLLSLLDLRNNDGIDPIPVPKKLLLQKANASPASLKSLVDKGIAEIRHVAISRLTSGTLPVRKPFPLNTKQTLAHLHILDILKTQPVVLLHGVTSSGKTEIYIHLIEHFLRQEKQVLYLLPEIALTAQIIQRLQSVFGDQVGVYHSRFSDAERVEVYRNLSGIRKKGSPVYRVILGVRSSVFLPFSNLGLIIVDEEHENTYKQFDPAPRYNARDAAVVLAGMHEARVVMGTATPSFESYMNARNGRYGLVELFDRYLDIQLPELCIVDTREARRRKQMQSHFSASLIRAIEETLENGEQVILFQNRRGFSPYIECESCGWIPHCRHCDVSLTYHKRSNRLRCHYCGYNIANPTGCQSCANTTLQTRGFGTEKVEDEIALLLPKARIGRLDLDTTRSKRSYERIITGFQNRELDILVGTQMVSKGLDFDHVRLVGILNADNMLNFPDFRSFERSYQLIAQVSGRAGRKGARGKVIVQTGDPEHNVIRFVLENNYSGFYEHQLKERLAFKYPPYYRLIKITLRHKKLPVLNEAANRLAYELRKTLGDRIVGPEFPLIGRLYSYHQKCILIKIERDKHFTKRRKQMQATIEWLAENPAYKSLQVIPDVDPYN